MQRKRFWGRTAELELLSQQLTRKRSATILHGDPQIGKSSIVREFATRLRADSKNVCRVGIHKAIATPHDPFVFAVADLLADIYRAKHLADQLAIIGARLRQQFTPSRLKEICESLWQALSDMPGVPVPKNLADWLLKEVKALDIEVKTPHLTAHEVEKVIRTLATACPSSRLVLIIDDLSSLYELSAVNQPASWDFGTLVHLLNEEFENVHLILTWKDDPTTRDHFERIRSLFLQHSGSLIRLGPMESVDVRVWIRNELPELKALVGEEQLVGLIEGLPKVAADLMSAHVSSRQEVAQLASQIKNGSYDYIHSYLKRCPDLERDILFYMSIDQFALRPSQLAALTKSTERDVVRYMKHATERNILWEVAPDAFVFEHDVKRRVVASHLFRFEMARHYLERMVSVLEPEIGVEQSITPLFECFRVTRVLSVLAAVAPEHRPLADWYRHWMVCVNTAADAEQCRLLEDLVARPESSMRPTNIKARLFVQLFAVAAGSDPVIPLSSRTTQRFISFAGHLATKREASSVVLYAAECASAYFALTKNNDSIQQLIAWLRTFLAQGDIPADTAVDVGRILTNAALPSFLRNTVQSAVDISHTLVRSVNDQDLQGSHAQTLVNAVKSSNGDVAWLQSLCDELLRLSKQESLTPKLAEACVRGFHDIAVSLDELGFREETGRLLGFAKSVVERSSDEPEVTRWYCRMLYNATAYFGRMGAFDHAMEALGQLASLSKRHPNIAYIVSDYVCALNNIATLAYEKEDLGLILQTCEQARVLIETNPDTHVDKVEYMEALAKAARLLRDRGEKERSQEIIKQINALQSQENSAAAAVAFLRALSDSMDWKETRSGGALGDPSWCRYEYEQLIDISTRFSDEVEIANHCAGELGNLALVTSLAKDWNWTMEIITRTAQIASRHAENSDLASHHGRALGNGYFGALIADDRDIALRFKSLGSACGATAMKTFTEYQLRYDAAISEMHKNKMRESPT